MKDTFFIILAGGSGERLWPLSTYVRPKQLLPFINGLSLLEQTVQRIQLFAKNKNHIIVVTNIEQQDAVKKLVGKQTTILAEPDSRNTAPAILLSCLEINEKNSDAVIVVMPSDHFIPHSEQIVSLLWASIAYASCHDHLILLGITPTYPSTSYGYIQYQASHLIPGWMCFPVQKFHEKPDKEVAQSYVQQNDMLWNIGIFVGKVSVFLQEFQKHAPDVWGALQQYKNNECSYEQIPKKSLDHAVLEKSSNVVVFPAHFEWHDVGTLPSFLMLKAKYEKDANTRVINVDADNNLVCTTKKVAAFVGVNNICVVETEEALLVVAHDRVESVRDVSLFIKEQETPHVIISSAEEANTDASI